MTTAGVLREFGPVSAPPAAIAAGPDGALWFPESNYGEGTATIGRITTTGVVTEYVVPVNNLDPNSPIAIGPDGALWFTDDVSSIVRASVNFTATPVAAAAFVKNR